MTEQDARMTRWQQKLLDFSLGNRLLNTRDGSRATPVLCPFPALLEDRLAANITFTLQSMDRLLSQEDCKLIREQQEQALTEAVTEKLSRCLDKNQLWSPLLEKDLAKVMTTLYRQARTDQEEGGINTLFLALGFLEWRTKDREARLCQAPVLLLPVSLTRASAKEGYRLSRLDEETIANATLFENLRKTFGISVPGINPLPQDESGVDVTRVLSALADSVADQPGWRVRKEVKLGIYSFNKFILWNDMTSHRDQLSKHPLVRHFMEGGGIFDDGVELFPPEEIGQHLAPSTLFCPLSADSSQLTAVRYSEAGKSFVLHGPPGTGKSQTITNIIAHNLALGRRVLFVAEKKAALDVVHHRLSMVGLRPFCLELHSNKSGKTEVLSQLKEALQVADTQEPQDWGRLVRQLQAMRDKLNGMVSLLHTAYPCGMSAHDCLSTLLAWNGPMPDVTLDLYFLEQDRDFLSNCRHMVSELGMSRQGTDRQALESYGILADTSWSPASQAKLAQVLKTLSTKLKALSDGAGAFMERLGCSGFPIATYHLQSLDKLAGVLCQTNAMPDTFMTQDFAANERFLKDYVNYARTYTSLEKKLTDFNLEAVYSRDLRDVEHRLQSNESRSWFMRTVCNLLLLHSLKPLRRAGAPRMTLQLLKDALPDLITYAHARNAYEEGRKQSQPLLANLWKDKDSDWDAIGKLLEDAGAIHSLAHDLAAYHDDLRLAMLNRLKAMAGGFEALKDEPPFAALQGLIKDFLDSRETVIPLMPSITKLEKLDKLQATLDALRNNLDGLRNALLFLDSARQAEALGLKHFAQAIADETIPADQASEIFEVLHASQMLSAILEAQPALSSFSGAAQNQRIRQFQSLDDQYIQLTRDCIFARLAARLPRKRQAFCPEGSELGFLKHECEKKMRQKPIRQILDGTRQLLATLKPCFLMSPLSVSQYLPADSSDFDLVIFDEASQIPVWDAIGTIARGKQLIVVGDPRQMPPTNFFQKGDKDDDFSDEENEDLESILDECLAAGVYSSHLNWHYRSRHESLIAFSNHYYYEDRLFTFPAACNSSDLGVSFRHVPNGIFGRGGARSNPVEAAALADFLCEGLANGSLQGKSIGVVTFSQAQKDLIEDLLEGRRSDNPALDQAMNTENEEPLFVKNLENVQGDERDVILFSIAYAPDDSGKFPMSFGPLNRSGGERRLNVAVTRAKERVVVFASITASMIDLNRTKAVGAEHLKHFLEYAERNGVTTEADAASSQLLPESLPSRIAAFLETKGYRCTFNLGCSGFKLDLAVAPQETPDLYCAGIICDGSAYSRHRTARDRDHVLESVMTSLGWNLCHAWSIDWLYSPQQAQDALLKAIQNPPQKTEKPPKKAAAPSRGHSATPTPAPAPAVPEHPVYSIWTSKRVHKKEFFLLESSQKDIARQIQDIIATEAPIKDFVLKKRLFDAWDISRAAPPIQKRFEECLPSQAIVTQNSNGRVFWTQKPESYSDYRLPPPEWNGKRPLDEIPAEELSNLLRELHADFPDSDDDVIFKESAKLMGFNSLTARMRAYLTEAQALLTH